MIDKHLLLSVSQAAAILGVTPRTIHAWRTRGYILAVELPNGRFLIPQAEIDRLAGVKP